MHNPGFLCGQCPDGQSVDLTLRQCKNCTYGDAIAVAVVGKILNNHNNYYYNCLYSIRRRNALSMQCHVHTHAVIAFFVASLLVLLFNVGIPNELKGCLFFVQVSGMNTMHVLSYCLALNQAFHSCNYYLLTVIIHEGGNVIQS